MRLATRYNLTVVLFFAGGVAIMYAAATGHHALVLALPGWLVFIWLLQLWVVRCPHCGTPAMLTRLKFMRLRVWIPLPAINERCAGCGQKLE